MKVLVIHCAYKYKGGEESVVAEEIKLLQSNGIEVELLEFNNYDNTLLKVVQLPFNVKSYITTQKKIKAYQPHIVHIHNLHFGASPSVIYAIKKSRVPFVITLHNYRLLCPSASLFHKGKPFLKSLHQSFPWSAIAKGVYQNSRVLTFWLALSGGLHKALGTWQACNKYIVLSKFAKTMFLESKLNLTSDKLVVKPNFCEVPVTEKSVRESSFLYIGRLSDEKGAMLILEAFAKSNYKIKIAGDGDLRNTVIDYSNRFKNIEYVGTVNKDEVYNLLSNCSALIFPSKWYEGMPLTIVEAFGTGTPVIASKIGAMEVMVTDRLNGMHFKPASADDLLEKLSEWQALSEEERNQYSANALHTYHQHYTPKDNFKQLLAIYNSVVKGSKEPTTKTLLLAEA